MNYDAAIMMLKEGRGAARVAWREPGVYVIKAEGIDKEHIFIISDSGGACTRFALGDYIEKVFTDGKSMPWLPSYEDAMACDWEEIKTGP